MFVKERKLWDLAQQQAQGHEFNQNSWYQNSWYQKKRNKNLRKPKEVVIPWV